jgi:DNA-binding MarR family transcriptional regulator
MQQTFKQQLTEQFVNLVERLNQRMHCGPPDEWEGLDLTIPQFKALALLQSRGPQRMGGLSASLGTTLSATTSTVDRLVDKGMVERLPDPEDRRVVICRLTPQGREAYEKFWRIGRMHLEELARRLDDSELETVVQAMELLCRAAEQD